TVTEPVEAAIAEAGGLTTADDTATEAETVQGQGATVATDEVAQPEDAALSTEPSVTLPETTGADALAAGDETEGPAADAQNAAAGETPGDDAGAVDTPEAGDLTEENHVSAAQDDAQANNPEGTAAAATGEDRAEAPVQPVEDPQADDASTDQGTSDAPAAVAKPDDATTTDREASIHDAEAIPDSVDADLAPKLNIEGPDAAREDETTA
ncbi:MAG TPA: hypothetical protein VD948_13335, partial [Rhodothermales bacterium]|nr:hypothetical protein [Rhodothermales bacterium]